MSILQWYLLAGLVLHKLVWELLKRRSGSVNHGRPQPSARIRLIKSVKIGILIGLVLQTLVFDVFPISEDPVLLRSAGVVIYSLGLLIAIVARISLDRNWSDIETSRILTDHVVVRRGIYRYIRHPIYVGDLLLLLGFELSVNSWLVAGAILLIPVILWQAMREEDTLSEVLSGYDDYRKSTKRFIPFVI